MITKEEIFNKFDIDEIKDMFDGYLSDELRDEFESVSSQLHDYDEGNVYYNSVVKHKPTNRYFLYITISNSWADYYGEGFDLNDVVEVKPVEVVKIEYKPI